MIEFEKKLLPAYWLLKEVGQAMEETHGFEIAQQWVNSNLRQHTSLFVQTTDKPVLRVIKGGA